MKPHEIRERTDDELRTLGGELRRELWKARFDNHTNNLDDTSRIRKLRRDVARVETEIQQRVAGARPEAAETGEQE
jgi:large subunit ribosomal protein L29